MTIPSEIQSGDIERAIRSLRDWPDWGFRASTKFCLVDKEGKHYPPKLVLSMASRYATGEELSPHFFSGGQESNEFLKQRGFLVVRCPYVEGKDRRRPHSG